MSETGQSPERMRYNLRSSAARQNVINSVPILPQPGCSSDGNGNEVEPENARKNLMMLVDDCLFKMFNFLELTDMCQISNVNKRLNALVKFYMQTKYHIQFEKNFDLKPWKGRINVEVAQAFFHIFGNEIKELTLAHASFDGTFNEYQSMHQLFSSLQQHCGNIKKCTLHGFGTGGLNSKIFKNLEMLTLDKCSVSRDWCKMNELKVLRMNEIIFRRWPLQYSHREYGDPPIPPISIPIDCFGRLTEVRLSDVNFSNDILEKFLRKNPKIRILSVVKCLETSPFFFKTLTHLKHLEEFEFKKKQFYPYEFHQLHKLNNLKVLKLSFNEALRLPFFEEFIKHGIAIEHFEIQGGRFNDEIILGITKIQTLKILKLYEVANLNETHILRIAGELKQLKEMHFGLNSTHASQDILKGIVNAANQLTCLKIMVPDRFNLDVDAIQAILDTLKKRHEKNPLELTIYGNSDQIQLVPDEMLKGENEQWLVVKVLDRNTNRLYADLTSKVGHPPPRPDWDSEDSEDEWSDY